MGELRQQERHDVWKRGPRFGPIGGAKPSCDTQSPETEDAVLEEPPNVQPAQLSPPLELLAFCVGRSLGFLLRLIRCAKYGWRTRIARLHSPTWKEALPSVLLFCGLLTLTLSIFFLAYSVDVLNANICLLSLLQVYFVFRFFTPSPPESGMKTSKSD